MESSSAGNEFRYDNEVRANFKSVKGFIKEWIVK